jgi:hypothetical protein
MRIRWICGARLLNRRILFRFETLRTQILTKCIERRTGGHMLLLKELFQFMREQKKYWLLPIVLTVVALGFLIVFSQTAVLPFVYTLF